LYTILNRNEVFLGFDVLFWMIIVCCTDVIISYLFMHYQKTPHATWTGAVTPVAPTVAAAAPGGAVVVLQSVPEGILGKENDRINRYTSIIHGISFGVGKTFFVCAVIMIYFCVYMSFVYKYYDYYNDTMFNILVSSALFSAMINILSCSWIAFNQDFHLFSLPAVQVALRTNPSLLAPWQRLIGNPVFTATVAVLLRLAYFVTVIWIPNWIEAFGNNYHATFDMTVGVLLTFGSGLGGFYSFFGLHTAYWCSLAGNILWLIGGTVTLLVVRVVLMVPFYKKAKLDKKAGVIVDEDDEQAGIYLL
jgi:hypothetical protein